VNTNANYSLLGFIQQNEIKTTAISAARMTACFLHK